MPDGLQHSFTGSASAVIDLACHIVSEGHSLVLKAIGPFPIFNYRLLVLPVWFVSRFDSFACKTNGSPENAENLTDYNGHDPSASQ